MFVDGILINLKSRRGRRGGEEGGKGGEERERGERKRISWDQPIFDIQSLNRTMHSFISKGSSIVKVAP